MEVRKSFLIWFCLFLCVRGDSPYNYHKRFGIKKAEDVRRSEWSGSLMRIIGGTAVPAYNHITFQAGIDIVLTTGWRSICGGSLVSNTKVLTAAHCWYDGQNQAREFTVVLGSTTLYFGGTRIVTTDVVMHPSWNTVTLQHDIAMVTIPWVQYSNNIQAVNLPTVNDMNFDFAGQSAQVSGYGKTSDAQNSLPTTTSLHQTSVTVITNSVCQKSYDFTIHVGHICTSGVGRVGTCDGDSGGPLTVVHNNLRTLIGIVSFGIADGCESGLPSVYTRVTAFVGWIQANL